MVTQVCTESRMVSIRGAIIGDEIVQALLCNHPE